MMGEWGIPLSHYSFVKHALSALINDLVSVGDMKIVKSSLKQTSFTCPSAWSGLTDAGVELEIHFRLGKLVLRSGGRILAEGERGQFDVSSFMDLDEALEILCKQGVEVE